MVIVPVVSKFGSILRRLILSETAIALADWALAAIRLLLSNMQWICLLLVVALLRSFISMAGAFVLTAPAIIQSKQ